MLVNRSSIALSTPGVGSGCEPVHALITFCSVFISSMYLAKESLTLSNNMLSCGSCLRISSDPTKMFSRYIHDI